MAKSYIDNLDRQVRPNQSFINKAVAHIATTKDNKEAAEKIACDYPHYNKYEAGVNTPYDSAFKTAHDKGVLDYSLGADVGNRVVSVISDSLNSNFRGSMADPLEKPFIRPVGTSAECTVTETGLPAEKDNRIKTITTGHYANAEAEKEANEKFGELKDTIVEVSDVRNLATSSVGSAPVTSNKKSKSKAKVTVETPVVEEETPITEPDLGVGLETESNQ